MRRSAARRASGDHPAARGAGRRRGHPARLRQRAGRFLPGGSYDPLDTLACGLFSAQLSDLFDRQSRLICDRAALTGSPADAAPFAVGAAASVVIFPGSDRFTWPLNSAARLVVNHGRLTHRRVWQEEMAHES
jgi:cytosine deaminase